MTFTSGNMICAGNEPKAGVCYGDSGAALVVVNDAGDSVLLATVSHGNSDLPCGETLAPAAFASVLVAETFINSYELRIRVFACFLDCFSHTNKLI